MSLRREALLCVHLAATLTVPTSGEAGGQPARASAVLELSSDSAGDWARHWKERLFGGREPTNYALVGQDGGLVLRGRSDASASAVWRELDLDPPRSARLALEGGP